MDGVTHSHVPAPVHPVVGGDACSICHDVFGSRNVATVRTRCGHQFDLDCITQWLDGRPLTEKKCGYCRSPALPLVVVRGDAEASNRYVRHRALEAACQGHRDALESMLASNPEVAEERFHDPVSDKSLSLLMAAARYGQVACVRLLLDNQLKQGHADSGREEVMMAIQNGHVEVLNLPLAHEVGVSAIRHIDPASLVEAAGNGYSEIVRILLDNGARTNVEDDMGWTALTRAARNGQLETVRLLLDRGAGDTGISNSRKALIMAAGEGHLEIVRLLLDSGANVNAAAGDGWTSLMSAADNGSLELVHLLLDNGAMVNATMNDGRTALMMAADKGHIEIVRLLLDRGGHVNAVTSNGWTAINLATLGGHHEILQLLQARSACLDVAPSTA